jgi:hypothetical protein
MLSFSDSEMQTLTKIASTIDVEKRDCLLRRTAANIDHRGMTFPQALEHAMRGLRQTTSKPNKSIAIGERVRAGPYARAFCSDAQRSQGTRANEIFWRGMSQASIAGRRATLQQ